MTLPRQCSTAPDQYHAAVTSPVPRRRSPGHVTGTTPDRPRPRPVPRGSRKGTTTSPLAKINAHAASEPRRPTSYATLGRSPTRLVTVFPEGSGQKRVFEQGVKDSVDAFVPSSTGKTHHARYDHSKSGVGHSRKIIEAVRPPGTTMWQLPRNNCTSTAVIENLTRVFPEGSSHKRVFERECKMVWM
ncbi:uncharacterized protein [Dermacentor albipictus]|uniref:uncharacterized protein n=1 Tax=Dermacentor albipictus TaxID=60249 RepID=UPI0031FE2FA6